MRKCPLDIFINPPSQHRLTKKMWRNLSNRNIKLELIKTQAILHELFKHKTMSCMPLLLI